jgi:sucrose-6F-phosphate phosphohydrolase
MRREKRWLLVSDVDDTLLGNDAALQRLNRALETSPHPITLVYNSSRPCASLRKSLAQNPSLMTPDFLAGALGTELEDLRAGSPLHAYAVLLSDGWHREKISVIMERMGLVSHPAEYQTPFKASYHVPHPELFHRARRQLKSAGLNAKLIFSSRKNLDIIPARAGKGAVVRFLRARVAVPGGRVVVAGDSGNDLEMFVRHYRGIVVANADPDLKNLTGSHIYHAQAAYAAGVLEGLRYWNVLPE